MEWLKEKKKHGKCMKSMLFAWLFGCFFCLLGILLIRFFFLMEFALILEAWRAPEGTKRTDQAEDHRLLELLLSWSELPQVGVLQPRDVFSRFFLFWELGSLAAWRLG